MGDLARWTRLLVSLDADERRARVGRVTDRLLRRSRWIRALGLKRATPSWSTFAAELTVSLEELDARLAPGLTDVPLERVAVPVDWHTDRVSGVRWDPETYFTDVVTVRLDGSDVKVPWELARLQHLVELGLARSPEAAAQALAFIAENPPGLGVNWASPMEVALRAVSLTRALEFFRGHPGWEPMVTREIARSLWVHGLHVRRNLEIPDDAPATNHYLANLLGLLAIAQAMPELRESAAWRELARDRLIVEMERQVGADGVSFERSLPYHAFVIEMLAYAARIEEMPPQFLRRLAAMQEVIAWSVRPDGTLPAWGDGDDGAVVKGQRLVVRPVTPEACGRRFENSGWHVLRTTDVQLGVGAGPVGTGGLGNHTHNDLFAPSCWAIGREWIVDPGTGSYSRDPVLRNRLRGVAAHAALQLGSREPNELPPGRDGLFRVIEKAHPEVVAWEATADRASLTARHTGYSGPEGSWTWERQITLEARKGIVSGRDRLEASDTTDVSAAPQEAWLRFPLATGLSARVEGAGAVVTDDAGRRLHIALELPRGSEVRVEPSVVSPRYDVIVPSTAIVARLPVAKTVVAGWTLRFSRSAP